jgi:hypothetical protein
MTAENLVTLRELAPEWPSQSGFLGFVPSLQGQCPDDYVKHIEMFRSLGVNLETEPLVAVGSVCRRQHTEEIGEVFRAIREAGIPRLHGFGVKLQGLRRYGHLLTSADSMAWSYEARRAPALAGCVTHKNCANCRKYAYPWGHAMKHEAWLSNIKDAREGKP